MSQVDWNLALSIEIAIFISVDVVEAIVLGEGGIWDNRRLVGFPVSELFDGAVFIEVARCSVMAVAAVILGANHFGVVGTVAGVALLGIDCGKRGSDGIALEPVASDGSVGKGVGGLGLQQQVHPSTCPLHQATWSYW